MPATATERLPPGLAEYPDLAAAIFNPLRELTGIDVIAQHIDLAVCVIGRSKGPHRTVAVGDQMRGRDDDIAFRLVFPAEQVSVRPTDQQMMIIIHVHWTIIGSSIGHRINGTWVAAGV
jgi:hypothetical protein